MFFGFWRCHWRTKDVLECRLLTIIPPDGDNFNTTARARVYMKYLYSAEHIGDIVWFCSITWKTCGFLSVTVSLAPSIILAALVCATFLMLSSLLPSHNTLAHSWFSFLPDKPCHSSFARGFQNLRLHIVVFMIPLHACPSNSALELYLSSVWPFCSSLLVNYQIKILSLLYMSLRWTHWAHAGICTWSWNALVVFSEWIDFIVHDFFSPPHFFFFVRNARLGARETEII